MSEEREILEQKELARKDHRLTSKSERLRLQYLRKVEGDHGKEIRNEIVRQRMFK
jgi:hypothetical protein